MAKQVPARNGGTLTRPEKGDPGGPGRPPKLITQLVRELKAAGYEQVGSSTMLHALESMLGLPRPKLVELASDDDQPMSVRIISKALLSAKGFDVLNAVLDRAHGKSKAHVDVMSGGAPIVVRFT